MLVFVDESGDPGRRVELGSSPYFVVSAVVFEKHDQAHAADAAIGELRKREGLDPRFEFRFNKCSSNLRVKFLREVSFYGFFYWSIVINKDPTKLYGEGFKNKDSFYKFASKLCFENAKDFLTDAKVVIDGSGSREFKQQLQRYLKREINDDHRRAIRKVAVEDSKANNLIQLADMVSGAVYRSYGSKTDANTYRRIVKAREKRVQLWPR